jgi:hypothetical protein
MFSWRIQCLARETIKTIKLFDVLLIDAYPKGEGVFEDQLHNTNSQRASNMFSNVFKCFMLISLPKKHESITY